MSRALAGAALAGALLLAGCSSTVAGSASPGAVSTSAPTTTTSSSAATPSDPGSTGLVTCDWSPEPDLNPPASPPDPEVPATGTVGLDLRLGPAVVGLELDRSGAPCAAAALTALADQGWFDGSPCHRLTTAPSLRVLQCGDPSGTGTGGPGFSYPTETDGSETYPRGTVAMANSGQGFDGSQFFLVLADADLGPDYTVVGTIVDGLDTLDGIAGAGVADGSQDGAPTIPVDITSATVVP